MFAMPLKQINQPKPNQKSEIVERKICMRKFDPQCWFSWQEAVGMEYASDMGKILKYRILLPSDSKTRFLQKTSE